MLFLLGLSLGAVADQMFAVTSLSTAPTRDSGGDINSTCKAPHVGLVDVSSASWVEGSCIPAEWAGDVLVSNTLESGEVVM